MTFIRRSIPGSAACREIPCAIRVLAVLVMSTTPLGFQRQMLSKASEVFDLKATSWNSVADVEFVRLHLPTNPRVRVSRTSVLNCLGANGFRMDALKPWQEKMWNVPD